MSFKFDLQTFAKIKNHSKTKLFNTNNDRIIYAYTDPRDPSLVFISWLVKNIEDLGTINSMSESTSPNKDFWKQDRDVEEMNSVFSLNSYSSTGIPSDILHKLNNEWRTKSFIDIDYFNTALSHMKLRDDAILSYAFYQLGKAPSWTPTTPAIPETPLKLNLLDFEKMANIDYLVYDAYVNIDVTGIVLNPDIKTLDYTFACKGYAKGILDIDYSNIEHGNQWLPSGFYEEAKLKILLGEDNKVIKFSKPPKIKGHSSYGLLYNQAGDATITDSEYILDLSNWDLSKYDPSYDPMQGGGNILENARVKKIIFPEGTVFKIKGSQFSAGISTDANLKSVENLAYDFAEFNIAENGLYSMQQILSGADYESLDEGFKVKLINFPETELYRLYKSPDNGYDGDEYTLETFYTDIVGLPLKHIEFIDKK